ncbi:MAG: hypothetical protein JXR63_04755 [Spirochaetales bacterium]|nr:hypothetical protein [Spirochaetales bacterium]
MKKEKKKSKRLKKEIVIPLIISVVGVCIALLVIIPKNIIENKRIKAENQELQEGNTDYSGLLEFNIEEFAIPNDFKGDKQPSLVMYRRQLDFWEKELVDTFFEDANDVVESILEEKARQDVQRILNSNEE